MIFRNKNKNTPIPEIKVIDRWLFEKFEEFCMIKFSDKNYKLLNGIDEKFIWEEIIKSEKVLSKPNFAQHDIENLCQLARTANKQIEEYCINKEDLRENTATNGIIMKWREKFKERCKHLKINPLYEFIPFFIEQQKNKNIINGQSLCIIGSDTNLIIYTKLIDILSRTNNVTKYEENNGASNKIKVYACDDYQAELHAVTDWIKAKHDQKLNHLLIISPVLEKFQIKLQNHIDREIQPKIFTNIEYENIYNSSLRRPLSKEPIISATFNLIKLNMSGEVSTEIICDLLKFNNWIDDQEQQDREKLAHYISSKNIKKISLNRLMGIIRNDTKLKDLGLNKLEIILNEIIKNQELWVNSNYINEWVTLTRLFLDTIQLGEINKLLPFEINNIDTFYKSLHQLYLNKIFTKKITFSEYLEKLSFYLEGFVPEPYNDNATIDIYGFDEYPIKKYDAIWVMNMNDTYYPGNKQINPFLSKKIQDKYHINDNHSLKIDLETKLKRIKNSSEDITISYSKEDQDISLEKTKLPNEIDIISDEDYVDKKEPYNNSEDEEIIEDHLAPPLNSELVEIHQGIKCLEAQLICPAWAFYSFRLGAEGYEFDVQDEISPMARGNLAHKVLELFWRSMNHSDKLLNILDSDLAIKIDEIVNTAITDYRKNYPLMPKVLIEVERKQLKQTLTKWVDVEKKRNHEFEIINTEEKHQINIDRMQFNIKIDRIDLIDSNKKIIIDYKTGETESINSLYKDSLNSLQLPIYACFSNHKDIDGVVYAKLNRKKYTLNGISREKLAAYVKFNDKKNPKIRTWDELLTFWHNKINSIASDYLSGKAEVVVFDEDDLKYCKVKSILRLSDSSHYNSANSE
ncbi:MAG: PD-(D/E)XK nuclease family protein [Methylophilaceae bacterium]|nr:PD-(D/E)XK nuclease family protein [Methylophilaceae bacterium]